MAIAFVLDEQLRGVLWKSIIRHNKTSAEMIDATRVGDPLDLPRGTPDSELLEWAANEDRVVISLDRKTLIKQFGEFLGTGKSSPGILLIRSKATIPEVVEFLSVATAIGTPSEFANRFQFIP